MRKIVTTNLYPIFLSKTSNLFILFGFFLDFARSTGKTTFVSIIVLTNKIPLKIGPTWPLIPPDSFRFIRPRGTTFSKANRFLRSCVLFHVTHAIRGDPLSFYQRVESWEGRQVNYCQSRRMAAWIRDSLTVVGRRRRGSGCWNKRRRVENRDQAATPFCRCSRRH